MWIFKYCVALYWKAENEFLNLFFIADGNKGTNHCNQYNFMIHVPAFSRLEKKHCINKLNQRFLVWLLFIIMPNVTKKKAQEQHYRIVYLVRTPNLPKITYSFFGRNGWSPVPTEYGDLQTFPCSVQRTDIVLVSSLLTF